MENTLLLQHHTLTNATVKRTVNGSVYGSVNGAPDGSPKATVNPKRTANLTKKGLTKSITVITLIEVAQVITMSKMLTTREIKKALEEVGLSYTQEHISYLIRRGYFPGAIKGPSINSPWRVPEESVTKLIESLTRVEAKGDDQ